jgi:hypothetical protein
MYLIDPSKKQYKANLHCHSVLSDGKKTPEELVAMYKEHGYDVLAITDHERPHQHQELASEDFMLLTGYECYIRPDPNARYNRYAKEVHLNLFARDPYNETMICYNECYAKYLRRDGALEGIVTAGSTRPREFTNEYIEEFVQTAKENGYIKGTYSDYVQEDGTINSLLELPNLSAAEMVAFCDKARKKYYLRPSYILHRLRVGLSDPEDLKRSLKAFGRIKSFLLRKG